jgi:hypothetical protein
LAFFVFQIAVFIFLQAISSPETTKSASWFEKRDEAAQFFTKQKYRMIKD